MKELLRKEGRGQCKFSDLKAYVLNKKVSKVKGVVNQVTNKGRYNFMLSKCCSFKDKNSYNST